MKKAVIILSVICVLLLITTGTMGMALRRGADGIRQAHFHVAMTTATLSIITHVLALTFALKQSNSDDKAKA